jgi:hypothetical protein
MPAVTGPERTPEEKVIRYGWITAIGSILIPILAIPGLILGAIAASKSRVGAGVAIMACSLILSGTSLYLWSITVGSEDDSPSIQVAPTTDGVDTDGDGMPDDLDSTPNNPNMY